MKKNHSIPLVSPANMSNTNAISNSNSNLEAPIKKRFFGTDGIRGQVGINPITPDFMLKLANATGNILRKNFPGKKPTVLIAKDTRVSGYMLESALQAGFCASGVDVILCGPLPTAGAAYLTRALRLQLGVVISASHNPYMDNGIKFFSENGDKFSDVLELQIEAALEQPLLCETQQLGKVKRLEDAIGRYVEFCKSTFNGANLKGMRLVVDCANGAAYQVAPLILHELGAEVISIHHQPNGYNINVECGATHCDSLQTAVLQYRADLGIALDGDADRVQIVDAEGKLYTGDELLFLLAKYYQQHYQQTLNAHKTQGVVGTLMTNLGIEQALKNHGINFIRANVGDRYVLEQLKKNEYWLGAEGSGHIITLDKHSTGDGMIAALQVLAAIQTLGPLPEFFKQQQVHIHQQVLLNVNLPYKLDWQTLPNFSAHVAKHQQASLENLDYRILIRNSGTEPKLRIMVESLSKTKAQSLAQEFVDLCKQDLQDLQTIQKLQTAPSLEKSHTNS